MPRKKAETPNIVASTPAQTPPNGKVAPHVRSSGFLTAVNAPKKTDPPAEKPAEVDPAQASYDTLFESAKKFVEKRSEKTPETSPSAKPAAEPPSTPPPALPPALVSRAREAGLSPEDLGDMDHTAAEKAVGLAERALLQAFRAGRAPQQQVQPPVAPEKPKGPPSLFKDEQEKLKFAPEFVELVERMQQGLHQRYQGKIDELEGQLQQVNGYVQAQVVEQGRSQIDQICDKLAEKGYVDIFGKGRAREGSNEALNKNKIGKLLGAEYRNYAEQGITLDPEAIDEAAETIAKRLWGNRRPPTPQTDDEPAPVQHKATQFTIRQPTQTARPTATKSSELPKGKERAIAAARGFYEANGNPLADIHGEE